MNNKVYEGSRDGDGTLHVTVDGRPLDPRLDLRNHSPTGLEIGYSGSGPAQCSLALLADATGDDELAQRLYQKFKFEVVSGMDRDRFLLTSAEIRAWIGSVLSPPKEDAPPAA